MIDYRAGDFTTFRRALLTPRKDDDALRGWTPTADGDLALQLLEWWAYLADILAFYNERALEESLLRTAVLPEDVRRIIRLLGYRPRPGIGATGVVAAIADSTKPFTVPRGFAIQGAGASSGAPQVFELDKDVEIGLLGRALPASARFPPLDGDAPAWSGYIGTDERGKLRNSVPADPAPGRKVTTGDSDGGMTPGVPCAVAVEGVVTLVQPDDTVLFLRHDWDGWPETADGILEPPYVLASVLDLEPRRDALGKAITAINLMPGLPLSVDALRRDYKMLKATKHSHLWLYHDRYPGMKEPSTAGFVAQVAEQFFDPAGLFTGGVSTTPPQDPRVLTSSVTETPGIGGAHLEAITRGIATGDPVLFEQRGLPGPPGLTDMLSEVAAKSGIASLIHNIGLNAILVKVTGYAESIWYANPPEPDRIGQGPPIGPPSHSLLKGGAAPIPIPHSKISFNDPLGILSAMSFGDLSIRTILVHYGWQEVGTLTDAPAVDKPKTVQAQAPKEVPPGTRLPALIEDATGEGRPGYLGVPFTVAPPAVEGDPTNLIGPMRALLHLLPVSRGQTVTGETLGSGDPILINQEFQLARSPLTYLKDPSPLATGGYSSTLRVRVDDIEWHEVSTFYGQRADARVFVTREDDDQKTYVRFGDGEYGARLSAGQGNVTATYRYGSGAEAPRVTSLTKIIRPQPGLREIRNPVAPGGGADPDPPDQIRRYAPRSVLTFDRAVSGDDYEALAAQTPGVSRALARWVWDPASQRTLVKLFVGDDDPARDAARVALAGRADPNRPVLVERATPILADLTFTLEVHPDYDAVALTAAVAAVLLDPLREPFGFDVVRIEDVVYDSQIYDACLQVPGVVAVHGLVFKVPESNGLRVDGGQRHMPGTGHFFLLHANGLHIASEVAAHGR